MVIDTSALVTMLTDEPGAPDFEAAIEADPVRLMSTASYLEAGIVIETRFGKGRHRAGLNYGDCFAYALAKTSGEPLLFKGDDFVHTDVGVVGDTRVDE